METRKFKRIRSELVVWFQTIDTNELAFGRPKSLDVSAGGIRLEMTECQSNGTHMELKFNIPGYSKEIHAKGKVNWCHKLDNGNHDLGIEFYEIADDDMKAIDNYASGS